jgi:protein-export membrane protein SecD
MKRCPTCSRVYDDEGLRFCLDDGTNLVDKLPAEPIPTTLVLPVSEAPAPTMKQTQPPDVPTLNDARPRSTVADAPRKRNVLLWIIIAALLVPFVAGAVVGGYVIFKKRALTWHLVLELGPTTNRDAAVKQTVKVIENRLDAMGVSHFEVKPQGEGASGRILINLPSVTDPERLKQIITTGGKLELVHVISLPNPSPVQTYSTKEQAIASLNSSGQIPPTFLVLPYVERAETSTNPATKWVVVKSPAIVDGSELRDAQPAPSGYGEDYQIQFSLNQAGAAKFGAWTGANINQYLGVVINDQVKSVAFIKSQISDQGVISGRFTKQSAEDLALTLRFGALPAPVRIVEERIDK